MESVVLVIHLILALAIIGLVLLQRSEGGGLGIGGGQGGIGNLATAQGAANALSRTTAILAACFFVTSLVLGILAGRHNQSTSLMDALDQAATAPTPAIEDVVEKTAPITPPTAPISE